MIPCAKPLVTSSATSKLRKFFGTPKVLPGAIEEKFGFAPSSDPLSLLYKNYS